MKQTLFTLELAFKIVCMIFVDFIKESKRELEDKEEYPQSKYKNCLERATAIVMKSCERALTYYACTIAFHRYHNHGDNHNEEIDSLKAGLSDRELKSASRP